MEKFTLLLFGERLPPHRHLHKLSNKFINIFLREREKEKFSESDYFEIFIEERYLGEEPREYIYAPVIPIHKDFLYQVESIYSNLNAEMILCTMHHEHPIVFRNQIEYAGYCYYAKNSDDKILFFDSDNEQLKKTFVKMRKDVNVELVMEKWLAEFKF